MEILAQLIIYGFAAFRISEMLIIDDAPFDLLAEMRGWFNRAPFDNSIRRNIANVLSCVHCTGIWVSLAFGMVYYFTNDSTFIQSFIFTLAVAGFQSALSEKLGRTIQ